MPDTDTVTESLEKAPYRLVVFWKEDERTKKTFLQYSEIQIKKSEGIGGEGEYEFYPLLLSQKLEEMLLAWNGISTMADALKSRREVIAEAGKLFDEAMETSDNPHCEIFIAQTALNHLMTVDLLFNLTFFARQLPLFFGPEVVAKTRQTGSLYLWLDPYMAGISRKQHKPLDTDEAEWPQKEELYCYFKRKSDPTVSPQQLANLWRTHASRIMEIDGECRQKLWEWLKGHKFSEDEIRALILP
jgi:hypothetical protein